MIKYCLRSCEIFHVDSATASISATTSKEKKLNLIPMKHKIDDMFALAKIKIPDLDKKNFRKILSTKFTNIRANNKDGVKIEEDVENGKETEIVKDVEIVEYVEDGNSDIEDIGEDENEKYEEKENSDLNSQYYGHCHQSGCTLFLKKTRNSF
jgi:hypothetical protein